MTSSREQSIDQIVECGRQVFHAIQSSTAPHWLELDLTMTQLKALMALAADGPVTIGLLGQKLGIHLPGASHVADSLVQLDLAARYEDPDDRRRTFVRLSATGQALMERLREGRRERIHAWLSELSDDDLAAVLRAVQVVARVVVHRR